MKLFIFTPAGYCLVVRAESLEAANTLVQNQIPWVERPYDEALILEISPNGPEGVLFADS
jgi:hypothetical protein